MTLLLERAWVRGAAPVPGELTLLTLNCLADSLARDFAHASPATLAWTHRCALLGAEVRRAAPHIACLQEVDEVHAPALLAASRLCANDGFAHLYARKGGGARDGCVLAWDTRRLTLIEHEAVEMRDARTGVAHTQRGLVASFEGGLVVATAHLKAKPGFEAMRAAQLAQLEQAAVRVAIDSHFDGAAYATVLCGDFNDGLSVARQEMRSGYTCAYAECGGAPDYTTWKVRTPHGGGEPGGEHRAVIDHVLTRRLRVVDAWAVPRDVPAERLPCARYPSDHVALAVRIVK